jgi:hypothetical protein
MVDESTKARFECIKRGVEVGAWIFTGYFALFKPVSMVRAFSW